MGNTKFDGGKKSNIIGLGVMIVAAIALILAAGPIRNLVNNMGKTKGEAIYTPGTYTASANGFGGEVKVDVTVSESAIEDIVFTGDGETPTIGGAALETIKAQILGSGEPTFDMVSGATVTSTAVKEALDKAIAMAKGEAAAETTEAAQETEADALSADIVIIGAGGAGMSAAVEASQNGAKNIVILEKMPMTGGNTTRATGGMNAAETTFQEAEGIEDSIELFVEDTMKGGKELNNKELVQVLAENSADAVYWVNDIGGDLSVVGQFGGASVKRIHRPSDTSAVGPMLVKTLNAKLEELDIPVLLNTKAEHIVLDENGAVKAVEAIDENGEAFTINTKTVILATGGFAANSEMVVKYNDKLAGFVTTNHAGATGDGIEMGLEVGAALTDIEQIQTHPTVNPDTTTMYTEGVRGNGAILVNIEGKRFVNELETRDVVSAAILAQPEEKSYLIFDQAVRESLSAIEKYIGQGIVTEAATVEELAEKIGIDAAEFAKTMEAYAGYQAAGKDDDFGRESMELPLNVGPFYAALCKPAVHHTMGGLTINTKAEVLNEAGEAIKGLFAAGEVAGGVHGGNRLGGNAVTDIVVFGRIAGKSAIDYVEANGGQTERTIFVDKTVEEAKPEVEGNFTDGIYTGTGKGNNGDVTVEVEVKDSDIVRIELTKHAETPGIYEKAVEGVIPEIIKKQTTEVDVIAGATNTSNAIKEAVNAALGAGSTEAATETTEAAAFTDGTYTGTAKGNNGDVTVEVVVENGAIKSITVTEQAETPGLYEPAEKSVIAEIIKEQSTDDIDMVAGSTNSSKAIKEAVEAALAQ